MEFFRGVKNTLLIEVFVGLLIFGVCKVFGVDLTAKAGDIIYSESKTPTIAVKMDVKEISDKSLIVFTARKGGFVFVRVLTDVPIMDTVQVDSITTKQVNSGAFKEKRIQCSWVEFKVSEGKKIARLIDIDGKTEYIYSVEKVLQIWKGEEK